MCPRPLSAARPSGHSASCACEIKNDQQPGISKRANVLCCSVRQVAMGSACAHALLKLQVEQPKRRQAAHNSTTAPQQLAFLRKQLQRQLAAALRRCSSFVGQASKEKRHQVAHKRQPHLSSSLFSGNSCSASSRLASLSRLIRLMSVFHWRTGTVHTCSSAAIDYYYE